MRRQLLTAAAAGLAATATAAARRVIPALPLALSAGQLAAARPATGNGGASQAGWPRSFANEDGSRTDIPRQPRRILSTSVTATGTLLAIGAPVAASASAANGAFFDQWAAVARQRGVARLWPAGQVDLEAAYASQPDLIIVSGNGADSAREHFDRLNAIAPAILINYGRQDWQGLAVQLGQALGLEDQAARAIAAFDARVTDARPRLRLPEGAANIVSYNGPGADNPIATASSPHARLLQSLGFRIESADPAWHGALGQAGDFAWAPYETLTRLTAQTTFVLRADDADAAAMLRDPVLANLPSVRLGQVYGLGRNSFRIDAYSAGEIIDKLLAAFAS